MCLFAYSYVIRLHVFISVVIASSGGPLPENSRSAWIAQQFSMVNGLKMHEQFYKAVYSNILNELHSCSITRISPSTFYFTRRAAQRFVTAFADFSVIFSNPFGIGVVGAA